MLARRSASDAGGLVPRPVFLGGLHLAAAASAGPCRAERGARSTPRRSARLARPEALRWSFGGLFGPVCSWPGFCCGPCFSSRRTAFAFPRRCPPLKCDLAAHSALALRSSARAVPSTEREKTAIVGQMAPRQATRRRSYRVNSTRIPRRLDRRRDRESKGGKTDNKPESDRHLLGTVLALDGTCGLGLRKEIHMARQTSSRQQESPKGHARVQDGDAQVLVGRQGTQAQAGHRDRAERGSAGGRENSQEEESPKKKKKTAAKR